MTDYTTQAARDAAPTVAPVEGCYALLRDGDIYLIRDDLSHPFVGFKFGAFGAATDPFGDLRKGYDIIATYTPAQLLAPRPDHTCPVQIEKVARAMHDVCLDNGGEFDAKDYAIAALKAMEDLT